MMSFVPPKVGVSQTISPSRRFMRLDHLHAVLLSAYSTQQQEELVTTPLGVSNSNGCLSKMTIMSPSMGFSSPDDCGFEEMGGAPNIDSE